jgi:glycosyltransferase involved in cell wall biosynthesis
MSGVTECARLVAEGLAEKGFPVTVLTGRHRRDLPREETLAGVRVVRAEPLLFLHKGYLSAEFVLLFRRLAADSDIVHLHLPMLESGLFSLLNTKRRPLVATYHCDVTASRSGSLIDRLAVNAVLASCRLCARRAARITVSSIDYARGSRTLAGLQDRLVELHPPDKMIRGLGGRKPLAGPGTPARVGFLGRFVEEKGIDVLLDAVPLVLRHLPQTRFVLAGDYQSIAGGSEIGRLRKTLSDLSANVELAGKLPEEHLVEFYRSLDLFVLPSINSYEAFGMVQVEAMKAGVPVIASDMRGVRTAVNKTANGRLVPPNDAPALAKAIVEYLNEARRSSAEEISERTWNVFSNEKVIEGFANLFRSLQTPDAQEP